ncbi:MAG: adaptor protein MecA [Ruminococcaceae bacterium]|nr:adaptor protein MecA [Oscillospiraceae bacterium]
MQCRMLSENGIEVQLSRDEMQALDITYENLDYANTETRRVLWTVLDEAGSTLGCNIDLSGRMLIEARPDGDGGCILDFTLYPHTKNKVKRSKSVKTDGTLLFETDSADALLRAVCASGTDCRADLYLQGGVFRLLLYPATEQRLRLTAVLAEFGALYEPNANEVAAISEYWPCVCKNAVQLLRSYALLRESKDVQN